MSRRAGKQKNSGDSDESGLSTAGKVALGVAAAAAGAAVGYFGSRLLSAWLSEPEEEKPKKCDASNSDDSKYDESKLPSKNDKVNEGNAHVNTSACAVKQQLSLHEQLFQYYREYVDIPSDKVQAVQVVVDHVTLAVRSQLREPNSFKGLVLKIGDMVSFGSVTEGLQVIRPNCFDVMIPIMFGSRSHAHAAFVGGRTVAGSFVIVVPDDSATEYDGGKVCDEEHRLVTRKLLDVLQVVVEKAVEVVTGYQYQYHCAIQPPAHNATAISIAVYTDAYDITVNFLPFVIIDSRLFLPVPDSTQFGAQSDIHGRLWMESFVRQEKLSVDRFESSVCGHLIALKILKAIRLNHPEQFGAVSSYHLKMLLFHVLEDLPESCDWDQNAVGERLIDLLTKLTEVLRQRHLPHYFQQNVNTLINVPLEMCNNLAKFLEKKLAHNDITSLLKRDY